MRITTLDILDTDSGVEMEVIDYDTDKYLGHINVNLNALGKLIIEHKVYDEPLDTEDDQ
jgi:hypothetical protein